jgi:hypothetical protein
VHSAWRTNDISPSFPFADADTTTVAAIQSHRQKAFGASIIGHLMLFPAFYGDSIQHVFALMRSLK